MWEETNTHEIDWGEEQQKANEKQGAELKLPVRDDGGSVLLFKRLTQVAC